MTDKVVSMEEIKQFIIECIYPKYFRATVDSKIMQLISAVRHEERERAVRIIDSTLKIPFENYLDVKRVKEKILEEK